jgi:ribosome biogenesis GTPase
MTKRRLNQQQVRRIRAQHQRTLERDLTESDNQPGLVLACFGKQVLVEPPEGKAVLCHQRANLDSVVAGDQVVWTQTEEGGIVLARENRYSVLERPDLRGRLRPIAANIDLMLIVIAPKPEPHLNLIDRYLVAAACADIDAAIVVNKTDLLAPNDALWDTLALYQKLGFTVYQTGREEPLPALFLQSIKDQTIVFVGQSGVGKSSIIQRLIPDIDIRIGALSAAIDKGRHTTTTAALYHLPGGGRLIDSPGIREFHLQHIAPDRVMAGFPDLDECAARCKFRDCRHDNDPGCAIREAVSRGEIAPGRLDSYRHIVTSMMGDSSP